MKQSDINKNRGRNRMWLSLYFLVFIHRPENYFGINHFIYLKFSSNNTHKHIFFQVYFLLL